MSDTDRPDDDRRLHAAGLVAEHEHRGSTTPSLNVQVRGTGATLAFYMFFITSPDNVMRGLAIFNGRAMVINGANARNNRIVGNFIGTDATGTFAFAAQLAQLRRRSSSIAAPRRTTSATPALADRNVISGIAFTGVYFTDNGTNGNFVQNNIIGLNPAGTTRLRNAHGRRHQLRLGAEPDRRHGPGRAQRDLRQRRRRASRSRTRPATTGNQIVGNFIGTDLDGQSRARLRRTTASRACTSRTACRTRSSAAT